MSYTYHAVLETTEMGYTVHCPELRGCWSQGRTKEEALENIKDAIETYLASMKDVLRKKDVRTVKVTV
ncbi:MAG: type II toxin-antitoxin system HicB family antitoxin [Elusimicrobia bacterium]|nr:type II toxin-antitoxin system HicB family antitoxin [Elusimicrobiota bacterium]